MEKTWGPKFWYVLHTIAFNYPKNPNKVTKRKYYDTVMNIPLFLPSQESGNNFSRLLDKFPVSPYLDSRESFIKWTHFIHNKVNEENNKPKLSYRDFIDRYTRCQLVDDINNNTTNKNMIITTGLLIIIALIYKFI